MKDSVTACSPDSERGVPVDVTVGVLLDVAVRVVVDGAADVTGGVETVVPFG